MSPLHRGTALLAGPVVAAFALTAGCSAEDRAAVAAAKCSLPVDEKAGLADGESPTYKQGIKVTTLAEGRYRVTGTAVARTGPRMRSVDFVCEVAPDERDRLRGFTVTRLEVGTVRRLG